MAVNEKKRRPAAPVTAAASAPALRSLAGTAFLERHALLLVLAMLLLGTVRIVATYHVFGHTFDEPAHVACGMEWLDRHTYTWETQHPPLSRVAAAIGPYLLGVRSQGTPHLNEGSMTMEGLAVLYQGGYDRNLTAARLGNLPFFWIACFVVYWWGRRYFSPGVAVAAVFLFTFLEPVLAHAGLATTDMALTAFLGAAFVSGAIWLERPSPKTGAIFGLFMGLAIISKFSTFAFFPASAAIALVWYWIAERPQPAEIQAHVKRLLPSLAIGVAIACVLIWTCYRFSFGDSGIFGLKLPFPELFDGIRFVAKHNAEGHPGYLLGARSRHGFWYFYPVVMAFKTPLAMMFLLAIGIPLAVRRSTPYRLAWLPLAYAAGILGVSFFSHINIGVRHILPVYMAFSLVAGAGAVHLWQISTQRPWAKFALAISLVWYAGASVIAHPDYLPYFNELAGGHPENILVDSDLDWGQDYKRLATRLRQLDVKDVTFQAFTPADLEHHHGFPHIHEMDVLHPSYGWNATGATVWKERRLGLYEAYPDLKQLWPDLYEPTEKVGKSIFLWYFPPPGAPGEPPRARASE